MKVTGIGGVFFRAKDPKALSAWYEKHLGVFGMNASYEPWTQARRRWPFCAHRRPGR
jgi:glyoxylase I family protein